MTLRLRSALLAPIVLAAGCLVVSCAGGVSLPAPVAAPTTTEPATSEASTAPSTTVADPSGCTADNATRSYTGLDPLPQSGQMPAGSSMAEIVASGRLRVGVSADTLLFGARNPLSGQIEGFDIDVLKQIAVALFGPGGESRLDIKVITYAQRLPVLEDNEVDLVAHTMTINCARWQRIAFSSEYFAAGQKVLVKKDSSYASIDQLTAAAATVCAPEGSTNLDEVTKNPKYAGLKVITRPDVTDCLVAIQQGLADAATGDDTVLAGLAAQDPSTEVMGEAFTSEPYGIGVNRDRRDLVEFVNGVLQQMRTDGTWEELYQHWLVPVLTPTAPQPPEASYDRP